MICADLEMLGPQGISDIADDVARAVPAAAVAFLLRELLETLVVPASAASGRI